MVILHVNCAMILVDHVIIVDYRRYSGRLIRRLYISH
jgi:hypothetical protein